MRLSLVVLTKFTFAPRDLPSELAMSMSNPSYLPLDCRTPHGAASDWTAILIVLELRIRFKWLTEPAAEPPGATLPDEAHPAVVKRVRDATTLKSHFFFGKAMS